MLTDFLSLLKDKWNLGYSGMVGYLQAISDAIEFCVFSGGFKEGKDIVNIMEIFVNRTRKALTKKMRLEWNKIFDIDYLEKQGCWATYENLQLGVPFHGNGIGLSLNELGMEGIGFSQLTYHFVLIL